MQDDRKLTEMLCEINQFHSDAASQMTLVSASMVGQHAATVTCSPMLLR